MDWEKCGAIAEVGQCKGNSGGGNVWKEERVHVTY
jgi:hypothetical protein